MALVHFTEEYNQLTSGEQAQFADVVRRLLTDGLIWREEEQDRRIYNFLVMRRELVAEYLQVAGWVVNHHEQANVFYVVHREGSHRRRLSRDTTIWLLLARLVYAEQRERLELSMTRYPTITVGELYQRYTEFFPSQAVRKKTSMDDALRTMQSLKLIRAGGGGSLQASDTEKVIELLPTLEVVVPEAPVAYIAEKLSEYYQSKNKNQNNHET